MRDGTTRAALAGAALVFGISAYVILGDRGATAPQPRPVAGDEPAAVPQAPADPPRSYVEGPPAVGGSVSAEAAVAELRRRIEQYRARHGAYPPTLDILRSGGPLPQLPPGMVYKYHHVTGRLEARAD